MRKYMHYIIFLYILCYVLMRGGDAKGDNYIDRKPGAA